MAKMTDSEIEYKAQRWTITLLSLICAALAAFVLYRQFKGIEENVFIISVLIMAVYVAVVVNARPLWKIVTGLAVAVIPICILLLIKNETAVLVLNLVCLFFGLFVGIEFLAVLFSNLTERLLRALRRK